ncbi:MAG: hypothetical protein OXQ29_08575 [Rhodospirillaceae bacterium]|nr:hypothetical protein [Rhodospirillaceae bacterium]
MRPRLSTPVFTTGFVVGVALVWGRISHWCVGWQVALAIVGLVTILLLTIRQGNREQINERKRRKQLDELDGSMRENVAETEQHLTQVQSDFERRLVSQLDAMQVLQERALERADPSYQRPVRAPAAFSFNTGEVKATVRVATRRRSWTERLRSRLAYGIRWIWGTHDN